MTELVWSMSLRELCQCEGYSEQVIVEIVEHGIAQPLSAGPQVDWEFDTASVYWLRKAVRLHADLDIDWVAVAMVIDLLRQNEALRQQNRIFQQQLHRLLDRD